MVKLTVEPAPNRVTIADMPVGSIGRHIDNGFYFYRTNHTAACLDSPGKSYTDASVKDNPVTDLVELLPPGARVVLTVA